MEILSTTLVRKNISNVIDKVQRENRVFGVGRRDKIEAVIIKYPKFTNNKLSDITNFNANFGSFDFLEDEPDLYSISDLKKRYV